jgi:hypothetical protein
MVTKGQKQQKQHVLEAPAQKMGDDFGIQSSNGVERIAKSHRFNHR